MLDEGKKRKERKIYHDLMCRFMSQVSGMQSQTSL